MESQALSAPADAPLSFRHLLESGGADGFSFSAWSYMERNAISDQKDLETLVFQMFGDPHQRVGIVRLEMVRADPEPGQFELDGQSGAAFRPDKGNDAAAVQVLQAKDPEDPQTEQGETKDGRQDHQVVGGQQSFPDGQIFPAHRVHILPCEAGYSFLSYRLLLYHCLTLAVPHQMDHLPVKDLYNTLQ